MPDTLSREEIAAIARHAEHGITQDAANVRALLAHIDALTAAAPTCRECGRTITCIACAVTPVSMREPPHDA